MSSLDVLKVPDGPGTLDGISLWVLLAEPDTTDIVASTAGDAEGAPGWKPLRTPLHPSLRMEGAASVPPVFVDTATAVGSAFGEVVGWAA